MATIVLFLIGIVSLLTFDPVVTAYLYGDPSLLWRFVTMFTHIVSHGNWDHLVGNYLFGAPFMLYLEHKFKSHKTFVRLFFALGLCSFFTQILFDKIAIMHATGLIGSSGAIFGLIATALMLYQGPRPIEIAARLLLLFYLTTQLQMAVVSLVFPMGVAYAAHLGGILGGIAFSLRYRRRHRRKSRRRR